MLRCVTALLRGEGLYKFPCDVHHNYRRMTKPWIQRLGDSKTRSGSELLYASGPERRQKGVTPRPLAFDSKVNFDRDQGIHSVTIGVAL